MDVLLWILIGLGSGWVVSKLMLSSGARPNSGTAAGLVGALLGGLGMRLLEQASGGDWVNTSAAALAGSLWLAWVVSVVRSRRRKVQAVG